MIFNNLYLVEDMAGDEVVIDCNLVNLHWLDGLDEALFLILIFVGGGIGSKSLRLMAKERFVPEMLKYVGQNIRKLTSDGIVCVLSFNGSSGT